MNAGLPVGTGNTELTLSAGPKADRQVDRSLTFDSYRTWAKTKLQTRMVMRRHSISMTESEWRLMDGNR